MSRRAGAAPRRQGPLRLLGRVSVLVLATGAGSVLAQTGAPTGTPTQTPTVTAPATGTSTSAATPTAAPAPAQALSPLVQRVGGQPALGPGWRPLNLPKQKPPVTQYSAELLDGRAALRIDARASYGNLAHALAGPAPAFLRWAWRVDQPNPAIDLTAKAGDDSPAKVCLSFDLPLARVPFFERELLRLARLRSAEPLPAATLCWAWGHAEVPGSVLPNPYTKRVRTIVLRGRADASGRWFEETRDVAADFIAAFGDETASVPLVSAVLVGGDADNTGAQSLAFVAGLQFDGAAAPSGPPAIPAAGK